MKKTAPYALNVSRRKELVTAIKQQYPNKKGIVVLFAGFESERSHFRQESSFYYMTGIREPGVVLVIDLQGSADLYIPQCDVERAKWMTPHAALTQENAKQLGIATVDYLGDLCAGYQFHPFFPQAEYAQLIKLLKDTIARDEYIFTLCPDTPHGYIEQRLILERMKTFVPELASHLINCAPIIADMRRRKDRSEIELMYKAAEITMLAQEAAAQTVLDGINEAEVQAALEYMFIGSQARTAFPSIVAGGKNATVLHYHDNKEVLRDGDLVVVDIGAEYEYYCADITRTYPVSGTFTKRQKEVYNLVLATQEYIASIAKPGMWLSNKEKPDQSLNHLAKKYLEERGYGKYFPHGIGHFLGLDVHDVGDYSKPLQEGDVITIEPGIYIPKEKIGIRIEDDYWIVKDGVMCLSEHMPKKAEEIEAWMEELASDEELAFEPDDGEEYDEDEEMDD